MEIFFIWLPRLKKCVHVHGAHAHCLTHQHKLAAIDSRSSPRTAETKCSGESDKLFGRSRLYMYEGAISISVSPTPTRDWPRLLYRALNRRVHGRTRGERWHVGCPLLIEMRAQTVVALAQERSLLYIPTTRDVSASCDFVVVTRGGFGSVADGAFYWQSNLTTATRTGVVVLALCPYTAESGQRLKRVKLRGSMPSFYRSVVRRRSVCVSRFFHRVRAYV